MKESISYTFLLNIIIVFIFTCFAIIMGVLSYYKAFRANTIITSEIEKYEGYNCISKAEIAKKLGYVGYNVPFNVSCNNKNGKCEANVENGYVVMSYNLDFDSDVNLVDKDLMNSSYKCDDNGCTTNKHYQYGVYTYMYVDLPVISSLLRIPFFSKTSTMYEFRNIYVDNFRDQTVYVDTEAMHENLYTKSVVNDLLYVKDNVRGNVCKKYNDNFECEGTYSSALDLISSRLLNIVSYNGLYGDLDIEDFTRLLNMSNSENYRDRAIIDWYSNSGHPSSADVSIFSARANRHECGVIRDYSSF